MKIAYLDHGKEIVILIAGSVSTPRCTITKEMQQLFQTCVHVYLRNSQPSHHMNSISTWVKLVFTDDEADNFSIAKFYSEFTVLIIVPILNLVNDTAPYPSSVKSAEIISFATVCRHTQKKSFPFSCPRWFCRQIVQNPRNSWNGENGFYHLVYNLQRNS